MTESPPWRDMPPDDDTEGGAARPFMNTPAPLPVAPWWARSAPDPTPPQPLPAVGVQDILETVPAAPAGLVPASPPGMGQASLQAPPADVHAIPGAPDTISDQLVSRGPRPLTTAPPAPAPPPGPSGAGRTRSSGRKALLTIVSVVLVLVVAAVAAVVLATRPKEQEVPLYAVTATGTAGGLRKDATLPEATAAYPFMIAAVRAGGVEEAATAGGVYLDPVGRRRNVLFLGGTAAIGDPGAFLQRARPSTALTVALTVPGKGGGQVSCGTFAVLSATHLYCVWATGNSFGFVASNVPSVTGQPAGFAGLTNRMRADLEKRTN